MPKSGAWCWNRFWCLAHAQRQWQAPPKLKLHKYSICVLSYQKKEQWPGRETFNKKNHKKAPTIFWLPKQLMSKIFFFLFWDPILFYNL
jgi:hypothetical protein